MPKIGASLVTIDNKLTGTKNGSTRELYNELSPKIDWLTTNCYLPQLFLTITPEDINCEFRDLGELGTTRGIIL